MIMQTKDLKAQAAKVFAELLEFYDHYAPRTKKFLGTYNKYADTLTLLQDPNVFVGRWEPIETADRAEALAALDKLFHYHGYTSWHIGREKSREAWQALLEILAALMQPRYEVVDWKPISKQLGDDYCGCCAQSSGCTIRGTIESVFDHIAAQGYKIVRERKSYNDPPRP
jgi:hypothetical protein